MNILFVNYGDFTTASLNHIGVFAGWLGAWGHDCAVAVPAGLDTLHVVAQPRFRAVLFEQLLRHPAGFADGRPADIVHAWTPRENVRKFVMAYQAAAKPAARLLVHLEDNEEYLISLHAQRPGAELRALRGAELERLVPANLPHPVYFHSFPFLADAVTHLTEPLRELAPATVRTQLLPPGLDAAYLRPAAPDADLKRRLGLQPGEKIIVYTGSNTFANDGEIRELYHAVALLNQRGTPTRLVRTGITPAGFLAGMPPEVRSRVLELGFVPKADLPGLLALADVLVQPGRPGPLDDYRLPSKLPEFLASGRPVIMPRCNLAWLLADESEAFFLRDGSAPGIAERCEDVWRDPGLAARVGEKGAAFARRYFDPETRSRELLQLYTSLLEQPPRPLWARLEKAQTSDLTATMTVLAAALSELQADPVRTRDDLAMLAEDLSCLSRFAEEAIGTLQSEKTELGAQLDDARRTIPSLRLQLQAMTEARDKFQADAHRLAAAEQRAQAELATAWSEHAGVASRVTELSAAVDDRDRRLRALKESFSWKVTAPLRRLGRWFGRSEG